MRCPHTSGTATRSVPARRSSRRPHRSPLRPRTSSRRRTRPSTAPARAACTARASPRRRPRSRRTPRAARRTARASPRRRPRPRRTPRAARRTATPVHRLPAASPFTGRATARPTARERLIRRPTATVRVMGTETGRAKAVRTATAAGTARATSPAIHRTLLSESPAQRGSRVKVANVPSKNRHAELLELPVNVDSYELERLEQPVTRGFTRVSTLIHLRGGGDEGLGEDITWYSEHHDSEQAAGAVRPLAGSWTLASFSDALGIEHPHHRWAYESAALDLALRQAGTSLADALGREPRPVSFVISPGLGDPPTSRVVRRWLELEPSHRFKLDPGANWSNELIAELAGTGAVVTADYKAYYSADDGPPPDPEL